MTKFNFIINILAVHDTRVIMFHYSDVGSNVESRFTDELDVFYKRILDNPERYGYYRGSKRMRRVRMKTFPYIILYSIKGQTIRIAGIIHKSCSDNYIQGRYL